MQSRKSLSWAALTARRVEPEGSGLPDRAAGALQRERGGHGYRQGSRCDGEGRGGAARAAHAAR
eukprot:2064964-Alexandrium_andersonii.AAC.1